MYHVSKVFGFRKCIQALSNTTKRGSLIYPCSTGSPFLSPSFQNESCSLSVRVQPFHSRTASEAPKKPSSFFSNRMKAALGISAMIGAYLAYNEYLDAANSNKNSIRASVMKQGEPLLLQEKPPEQKIARSIHNPKDASGLKLTLYQYQTCPFCCKVRAFLDYYGFSYDVVEVNSVTRSQTKWTSYKKVPFLLLEIPGSEYGESTVLQLKDSSMIISALASVLCNPKQSLASILEGYPSYYNEEGKLQFHNRFSLMFGESSEGRQRSSKDMSSESRLRQWVDDRFVHTLSPNVYRSPTEALQAFNWFSEVGEWEKLFSTWERLLVIYAGAAAMWVIGKRLKKKYNIDDDPRVSLYKEAKHWNAQVKAAGGQFAGGQRPNLADLAMFGVLTAIEGCDAFQDLLANDKKIGRWFAEMKERVNQREGENLLVARCAVR